MKVANLLLVLARYQPDDDIKIAESKSQWKNVLVVHPSGHFIDDSYHANLMQEIDLD